MPDGLTITGLTQAQARTSAAASRIPQTLAGIMRDQLGQAVTYGRARYLTGGTTADRLASRTGTLRAAFDATVTVEGSSVVGQLGYLHNPPPWASVHEGWPDGRTSTTIRPSHAQYLAIPLTATARTAGSPRDYRGTLFAARSTRGNLLLFERVGKTIQPVYLLRSEVIVPARPAVRPTAAWVTPRVRDALAAGLTTLLRGG